MNTLAQDIDDLDRMIVQGAPQDGIRSQVRLIAREITALEADYAALAERHAKLEKAHLDLQEAHSELQAQRKRELDDWLYHKAQAGDKLMRSKRLR